MKKPSVCLFSLIAAAALLIPIAASAQSDPCQLENRVRVQHGNLVDGALSNSPSAASAENFSFPVDVEILSIGWLGGSLSGAPGASFVIAIYPDLEGLPDASSGVVVFSAAPDQALRSRCPLEPGVNRGKPKSSKLSQVLDSNGDPGAIRMRDPQLRRLRLIWT